MAILYVIGNIFEPLSYLVFLGGILYLGNKKKNLHLIIFLLLILILGDSREKSLFFAKQLRLIIIIFLALKATVDLLNRKYRFDKLLFIALLFYFIAIIGATRNYSFGNSFLKATSYFLILYVGIHYLNYHIKESKEKLLKDVFYLASLVFGLGLIYLFLYPKIVIYGLSGRYRGLLGNPNGIGIYSVLMSMVYFLYLNILKLEPNKLKRIFFWSILLISLFISYSRGALLAVIIFYFIQFVYKGSRIKQVIFYLMVLPIGIVLINIDTLILVIQLMGLGEKLRVESILTGSGRFFAWQWAWEVFQENIWLGRGFAFEETLFKNYMPAWLHLTGHQGGVHNSYLAFLLNIGIIGTSLIVSFYLLLIRRIGLPNIRKAIVFSAGLSAFFEPWLNASLNAFTVHLIVVILFYIHLSPPVISNKFLHDDTVSIH